jgi:hypothetical protein
VNNTVGDSGYDYLYLSDMWLVTHGLWVCAGTLKSTCGLPVPLPEIRISSYIFITYIVHHLRQKWNLLFFFSLFFIVQAEMEVIHHHLPLPLPPLPHHLNHSGVVPMLRDPSAGHQDLHQ